MLKIIVQDTWCTEDDEELHQYLEGNAGSIETHILSDDEILSVNPNLYDCIFASTGVIQMLLAGKYAVPDTYSNCFHEHYYRNIRIMKFGETGESYPFFIKPRENNKMFLAQVVCSNTELIKLKEVLQDNDEVYVADCVNFVNEFRLFVGNHELCYIRESSDYILEPSQIQRELPPKNFIDSVLEANQFSWCVIDIGLTVNGDQRAWSVVEVNPPFALSSYGLPIADYVSYCTNAWLKIVMNKA